MYLHNAQPDADRIAEMQKTAGVYLTTDINEPGAIIPMVSLRGKIYSMVLDDELSPQRFLPTARISGPFFPQPELQQQLNPKTLSSFGAQLASVAESLPAESAIGMLVGGLIGNTIGHITDEKWAQMMAQAPLPCDTPECDCHKLRPAVMKALDLLREDWKEQTRF